MNPRLAGSYSSRVTCVVTWAVAILCVGHGCGAQGERNGGGGDETTAPDPAQPLQWHLGYPPDRVVEEGPLGGVDLGALWPRLAPGAHAGAWEAWEVTEGDPSVVIAVLDHGAPLHHRDLPATAPALRWDFVDRDPDPTPPTGGAADAHGVAVAALALAPRNGVGVVGVCPRCSLAVARVLAAGPTDRDGDLVAAVRWAAERADVILASWSYDPGVYVADAMHEALRRAAREGRGGRGSVVVFSAGNAGRTIEPYAPQALAGVLAVGATDEEGRRAFYSNEGPALSLVAPGGAPDEGSPPDVVVPRPGLVTADLEGDAGASPEVDAQQAPEVLALLDDPAVTGGLVGTSGAAPLVAGAAGLVLSVAPERTANEVAWILTETATRAGDHRDDAHGYGRLDVGAAVAMALDGAHCHEHIEACGNGVDDDCDRLIDDEDPDCGGVDARPFLVSVGSPCATHADCGDGICGAPEGRDGQRTCTSICDYDCPAGSSCVGLPGLARCRPTCARDDDCPVGHACAIPEDALVPPGHRPSAVCISRCDDATHCAGARCAGGLCAAGLPGGGDVSGSGCTGALPAPWIAVALLIRRRRR